LPSIDLFSTSIDLFSTSIEHFPFSIELFQNKLLSGMTFFDKYRGKKRGFLSVSCFLILGIQKDGGKKLKKHGNAIRALTFIPIS
jgi:hypothetical protein